MIAIRRFGLLTLATAALSLGGCATYQSGLKATEAAATADTSYEGALAVWTNERGTAEGMQKAISALEAVIAAEPENQEALILLSRSYYFQADGYTDDAEVKSALFEKGVTMGERAMAADAAFKAKVESGTKPADAVTALQKDDQMAIYWTASNLGKWARSKGFSTLVKYKGYIAKMMTHCLALDETAFYAGPVRYWGAFYAVAPSFAGGDLGKSKENYDKALKMAPQNFATYVLYADTYATKVQDRALFERLLKHVIDTPADVLPDMIPEQEVEKKKAQAFLDKADELFAQ
jgi:tetratricopeptide (TPR) repeat protein